MSHKLSCSGLSHDQLQKLLIYLSRCVLHTAAHLIFVGTVAVSYVATPGECLYVYVMPLQLKKITDD